MTQESKVVELQFLNPVLLPEAVADRSAAEIKDILDYHTPVDQTNQHNQTALFVACELGKEEIVALLISCNAQLEAKDSDGMTPLSAASRSGSISCVRLLIDAGAAIDTMDEMNWTPLMWASYKGHTDVVKFLLSHDASVHHIVSYNMTALLWASGRGYTDVVKLLLGKEAKVNSPDKFGSTALIWASRRGYCDIVSSLLENGADINAVGAGGANALITAAKNGYDEVIRLILQKPGPNVNHTDRDSNSALTYAAKQGKHAAIAMLLDAGAYLNLGNRSGQTPLIKAVKYGHLEAVRVLLGRYADVDIRGKDNWTALHYSCDRNHIGIVKEILSCNPDMETVNDNGDTPLMLAVKSKNIVITRMLIDKGALVSAMDKKKDTPLHIAIRARSVRIASLLLRKPQDARMLYQPNVAGETPYNLDASHNKSILASIFGARNMSPESDLPDITGPALPGNYDLYSSALADILSEPTLTPPLTVGLYAKWGSGKSLLLQRLEKQMQLFTCANKLRPLKNPSVISFGIMLLICIFWGIFSAAFVSPTIRVLIGLVISAALFILYCFVMGLIFVGVTVGKWNWALHLWKSRQKYFSYITLLFQLWFMVPPAPKQKENDKAIPVRFLFTKYSRLTSVGGQTSLAEMIGLLCRSAEKNLGFAAVRLYRPFQDDMAERGQRARFRKICCLPAFIYVIVFILSTAAIVLASVYSYGPYPVYQEVLGDNSTSTITPIVVSMLLLSALDVVILLIGAPTLIVMISAIVQSPRTRLLDAAHHTKSQERLIQQLKQEVDLLCQTVIAIDAFTHTQTRLCVTINGLDSCEQDKILQVLDTIQILFSQKPYITLLSIDPVIISKAIHGSLNSAFRDADITGHDYLKNVIHLPFFLRETTRKLGRLGYGDHDHEESGAESVKEDSDSPKKSPKMVPFNKRHSSFRRSTRGADLGKLMFNEEWFSNMSPQLVKRVMHIVTLTGRLLRADGIDFSWAKLAAWIYVTEQWPYRTSFLLHILEMSDCKITLKDSLRSAYEKNSQLLNPNDQKLVIDSSDDLAFRSFISARSISVTDVCNFLPCTVNLDPKLFDPIAICGHSPLSVKNSIGFDRQMSVGNDLQRMGSLNVTGNHVGNAIYVPVNMDIGNEDVEMMTADDVADLIFDIKGLSRENATKYASFVRLNNLNGAALLACELDDLKKELFAPFGDWCLLKQWIQRMKSSERHNIEHVHVSRQLLNGSNFGAGLKDSGSDNDLELGSLQESDRAAYDNAFKEYLRLRHNTLNEANYGFRDHNYVAYNVDQLESLRSSARDCENQPLKVVLESEVSGNVPDNVPLLILHSHPVTPN